MKKTWKTVTKRVVAWLLVLLLTSGMMPDLGLNLDLGLGIRAEAAETTTPEWKSLNGTGYGTGSTTLSTGYYYLKADKSFTGTDATSSAPAKPGLKISGEVHIYIPENVTLTVTGGAACGKDHPGAPGIELPSGSKLYFTGKGKVTATGGKAAKGGDGTDGGDPRPPEEYELYQLEKFNGANYMFANSDVPNIISGDGGNGGYGGAGAGAGIGTFGGTGGTGGTGVKRSGSNTFDNKWIVFGYYIVFPYDYTPDSDNAPGDDGTSAAAAGTLYNNGVTLDLHGGEAAKSGTRGSKGAKAQPMWDEVSGGSSKTRRWTISGGAGGGGGGGGKAGATYGSGGGGGGGGGAGGPGGVNHTLNKKDSYFSCPAKGGKGGQGAEAPGTRNNANDSDGSPYGNIYDAYTAKAGGKGGKAGNNATTKTATKCSLVSYKIKYVFPDEEYTEKAYNVSAATAVTLLSDPRVKGWKLETWGRSCGTTDSDFAKQNTDKYDSGTGITLKDVYGDITFTAIPADYTATLDAWGGTGGTANTTVTYWAATDISGFTAPTKPGYTFDGYYDKPKGETDPVQYFDANGKAKQKWEKAEGGTLYAHWVPNEYTIQYWSQDDRPGAKNDAAFVKEADATFGSFSLPTAEELGLTREHYDFIGWNVYPDQDWAMYREGRTYTGGLTTGTDTVTVYAAWKMKDSFSVSFKANGGVGAPPTAFLFQGDSLKLPTEKPTRDDYTFLYWTEDPNGTNDAGKQFVAGSTYGKVETNLTFYAQWKANNTVKYNANGGVFSEIPQTVSPAEGATVAVNFANLPTRDGYVFAGWATAADASEAEYWNAEGHKTFTMDAEPVTLYAVWQQKEYTVTPGDNVDYDVVDKVKHGERYTFTVTVDPQQQSVDHMQVSVNGNLLALPVPTTNEDSKNVYTFTVRNVTEDQNIEVTGIVSRSYNVALYPQGGTVTSGSINTYTYGVGAALPSVRVTMDGIEADISRTGYTFEGWYDAPTGGSKVESITATDSGDKVYYAHWTANTYTVTYHNNDSYATESVTEPTAGTYTYGSSITLKAAPAAYHTGESTKVTDAEFLGWATVPDATAPDYRAGQTVWDLTEENGATVHLYGVWRLPNTAVTTLTYDTNGVPSLQIDVSQTVVKNANAALTFPDSDTVYAGKTFVGWSTEKDNTAEYTADGVKELAVGTDPVVLYAVWQDAAEESTYSVEYNSNDSRNLTSAPTSGIKFSDEITLLDLKDIDVSIEEYTNLDGKVFKGWAKSKSATVPDYFVDQKVTALASTANTTVTLYAVWASDANTKYVIFDANGGYWTGGSTVTVMNQSSMDSETGEPLTKYVTEPIRPGMIFAGWYDASTGGNLIATNKDSYLTEGSGNKTLYAHWDAFGDDTYTVTFKPNGGSGSETSDSKTVGTPIALSLPTGFTAPDGKSFAGWATSEEDATAGDVAYREGEIITAPTVKTLTLYAVWQGKERYVIYEDNGGTGGPGVVTVSGSSPTVASTEPTRKGYTFKEWNTQADGKGNSYDADDPLPLGGDMVLYAVWEARTAYTVTYDAAGGVGVPTDMNEYYDGDTVTVSFETVPARTGYQFAGWKKNGTGPVIAETATDDEKKIELSENLTLTAQWTANQYTIAFNGGDAAGGTMTSMTEREYGKSYTLPELGFTARTGWEFLGWSTVENGNVVYADKATVKDLTAENGATVTLYALWQTKEYTITYINIEGDPGDSTQQKTTGGMPLPAVTMPVRACYIFDGYYSGRDGTGVQYYDASLNAMRSSDYADELTLYAKWIPETLSILYMQDGQELARTTVTYDQPYTFSNTAEGTTPGVTKLAGWSLSDGGAIMFKAAQAYTAEQVNALWGEPYNGGDITLFAVIKDDKKYTVSYNANGGDGVPTDDNEYLEEAEVAVILTGADLPVREHYTFLGWARTANATEAEFTASGETQLTMAAKNITLYAVWQAKTYVVTFDGNQGYLTADKDKKPEERNTTKTQTLTYDSEGKKQLPAADVFTRDGYVLVAWARDMNGAVVAGIPGDNMTQSMTGGGACTLYAVWKDKSCEITLNYNNGTGAVDKYKYDFSDQLGTLPAPTREGYTFDGWYTTAQTGGTKVTSTTQVNTLVNATAASMTGNLYARWKAIDYAVKVESNCGAVCNAVTIGDTAITTGDDLNGKKYPYDTQNVTFKVSYNPTDYTGVTVKYNGTKLDPAETKVQEQTENIYTIEKIGTANVITVDYADYKYTVQYHTNFGEDKTLTQNATGKGTLTLYGTAEATAAKGFANTGYTLSGWATKADGKTAYELGSTLENPLTQVPNKTIELYAVWVAEPSVITFSKNGAKEDVDQYVRDYTDALGALPTVSKDGYKFDGWYYTATFTEGTKVTNNTKVSDILTALEKAAKAPITLYAKWTPNQYPITIESNCGASFAVVTQAKALLTAGSSSDKAFGETVEFTVSYNKTLYPSVQVLVNGVAVNSVKTDESGKPIYQLTVGTTNVITVTALEYTYKVTYKGNGTGAVLSADKSKTEKTVTYTVDMTTGEVKTALEGTIFERTNYTQVGWAQNSEGSVRYDLGEKPTDPLTTIAGNTVTLYAVWETEPDRAIEVETNCGAKVTFTSDNVDNGFLGLGASKAQFGKKVTFTVSGIDADYTDVTVKLNGTALTAVSGTYEFTVDNKNVITVNAAGYKYKVTYKANGGTGDDVTQDAVSTAALTLYANADEKKFTRTGHTPVGWALTAKGEALYSFGQNITEPLTDKVGKTVTLYAVWEKDNYAVTFDAKGGTLLDSDGKPLAAMQYSYGDKLGALPVPTRTGYTFGGWYTDPAKEETLVNKNTVVEKDIALKAKWTANSYPITIESDCGATYAVDGGATSGTFGTKVTFAVVYDHTLYPGAVTVTVNGVTVTSAKKNAGGDPLYELTVSTVNAIRVTASDHTYQVKYEANGTNAVLRADKSKTEKTVTYTVNRATGAVTPALEGVIFEREGYKLIGWAENRLGAVRYEPDETPDKALTDQVGKIVTLYAVWAVEDYKVTFEPGEGAALTDSYGNPLKEIQYAYGDKLGALPVPTKTGHTFDGWYTDLTKAETRVDKDTVVEKSIKLYAKWNVNSYPILFETNCGAAVNYTSGNVTGDAANYGETVKFKVTDVDFTKYDAVVVKINGAEQTPTVTDANKGSAEFSFTVGLENTVSVVKKNYKYYVAYDNNGGTGEIATQTVIDGVSFKLSGGTGFTKDGAVLQGWTTTQKGAVVYELNSSPDVALTTKEGETVTLYAVWKDSTYTVTFNSGEGGSPIKDFTRTYKETLGTLPVPEKEGYTFRGWYIDLAKEDSEVTSATRISDIAASFTQVKVGEYTIELKALWTIDTFNVTVHRPDEEVGTVTFADPQSSGTVDNDAPSVSGADHNTEIEFTVTPAPGYKMKNLIVTANGTPLECEAIDEADVGTFRFTLTEDTVLLVHDGGSGANFTVQIVTAGANLTTTETDDGVAYEWVYDGENHVLEAALDPAEGLTKLTYQWYVDGHLINGATQQTYKVKNVADSGSYQCIVKGIDPKNGNNKEYTSEIADVTIEQELVLVSVVVPGIYYGQPKPNFTVTYDGFAAAETKAVVNGRDSVTVRCDYTVGSDVGEYDATPEIGALWAENYCFKAVTGKLVVNKRPVIVSWGRDPEHPWTAVTARVVNLYGFDRLELTVSGNRAEDLMPAQYTAEVTAISGNENYTLTGGSNLTHNWSVFMRSEDNDVPVWYVTLDQHEATWSDGLTLTAVVYPENADNRNVTWSSSDESVVTVNNGVVTRVGTGTAIITATAEDGGSMDSCVVTVEPEYTPPLDMTLDRMSAIITTQNGTVQLHPTVTGTTNTPTFTSSDEVVVKVDANGLITGLSSGSATVTATLKDGEEEVIATCDVIVFISDTKTVASIEETALCGTYVVTYTDGSTEYIHCNVSFHIHNTIIETGGDSGSGGSTGTGTGIGSGSSSTGSTASSASRSADVYRSDRNGKDGVGIVSIEKTDSKDNVDTYTITYTDGTTSTFLVTNGKDGKDGKDGADGADGHTPVITIGDNGNWFIDGIDTGKNAVVKDATVWGFVGIGIPVTLLIAAVVYLYQKMRKLEKLLQKK